MTGPDRPGRRGSLALPILIAALAAFAGVISGGVLYFRDLLLLHRPIRAVVREQWGQGMLPLWDPLQDGGRWLLANPNHRILHPSSLLDLFLPLDGALAAAAILQVFLAGYGVALLLKDRGCSTGAARLAGIAGALSGPILSLGNLPNLLAGVAWVPLALWAGCRAWRRPRVWTPLAALLACVPLLAGSVECWGAVVFILTLLALFDGPGRLSRLLVTASIGGWSLLLGAVQMVPALAVLRGAERGMGFREEQVLHWSMPPLRILESVVPRLWGNPVDPAAWWGGPLFDGGLPLILSAYLGAGVMALAIAGWWASWRGDVPSLPGSLRALVAASALAGGAFLFLALGHHNPILGVWPELAGAAAFLRYPERLLPLAILGVSMAAGAGWHVLEAARSSGSRLPAWQWWAWLVPAAALLGAWLAASLGSIPSPGSLAAAAAGPALGFAALAGLLGCLWLAGRPGTRRAAPAVASVLLAGDLLAAHLSINPTVDPSLLAETPEAVSIVRAQGGGEARLLRDREPRVRAEGIPPGAETIWARRSLSVKIPLEFGLGTALASDVDRSAPLGNALLRMAYTGADPERAERLADRAGASWALRFGEADPEAGAAALRARVFPGSPVLTLHHRPTAAPRVELLPRAEAMGTMADRGVLERLVAALGDDSALARGTVYLNGPTARSLSGGWDKTEGRAVIAEETPTRVAVETAAPGEGALILRDSMAAGWSATLDGRAVPILRADLAWRGVHVPAGDHEVVFTFHQPGLALGGALTLLGLGAVVVFGAARRRVLAATAATPAPGLARERTAG